MNAIARRPVQKNINFTPGVPAKAGSPAALPRSTRALLVKNGTSNPDWTFNIETARRLGWTVPPSREPPMVPREQAVGVSTRSGAGGRSAE